MKKGQLSQHANVGRFDRGEYLTVGLKKLLGSFPRTRNFANEALFTAMVV